MAPELFCYASNGHLLCLFFRQAAAYDEGIHIGLQRGITMSSELSETTILQAGQTLRVAVDPGFTMLVTQGSVHVASPPTWFGETMFTMKTVLHEGEVHVVERGGWIEVSARSAAQVRGLPRPARKPQAAASRVARLVQLLTGDVAWRS